MSGFSIDSQKYENIPGPKPAINSAIMESLFSLLVPLTGVRSHISTKIIQREILVLSQEAQFRAQFGTWCSIQGTALS